MERMTARKPAASEGARMKITAVETYLMQVGGPRCRGRTSDRSTYEGGNFGGSRNWLFVRITDRRGHLRRRRMLRMAAGHRDGDPGSYADAHRRGPGPHRPAVAQDAGRDDGSRHARNGRRRRDDRHRDGALGHQGQGAGPAGLEPARRPVPRPGPRLWPRQDSRQGRPADWRSATPASRLASPGLSISTSSPRSASTSVRRST